MISREFHSIIHINKVNSHLVLLLIIVHKYVHYNRIIKIVFYRIPYMNTKVKLYTVLAQYSLLQNVVETCQKKSHCKFQSTANKHDADPCPDKQKFVEVAYKCRPCKYIILLYILFHILNTSSHWSLSPSIHRNHFMHRACVSVWYVCVCLCVTALSR